ncbi:MAG TPA: YceI family protein [bacterium]|nr:YceI family protein [bacterium]
MRSLWGMLFFLCFPGLLSAMDLKGNWTLEKSEISYLVTHPLHQAVGKSTAAKGKGSVSYGGVGRFLVAVPVKSFDSGDANRDFHMLEITRGGTYPMVVVNVKIDVGKVGVLPAVLNAEATVDFAGKEKTYPHLPLKLLEGGPREAHLTGTLPISLKDFDIQPPSLLAMPIEDEVPVSLDMVWLRQADNK